MSRRDRNAARADLPLPGARRTGWLLPGLRVILALLVLGGVAGLAVWGFLQGRENAADEAARSEPLKAPSRLAATASGAPIITLTEAAIRASGIEVATPARAPYRPQLRAYATVLDIGPLSALAGDYAVAQTQVQAAQATLAASKAAYTRAQALYHAQQNVSQADAQAAEATWRTHEAALTAADVHLRALAAASVQDWGEVLGRALLDRNMLATRLLERKDMLVQATLPAGIVPAEAPTEATLALGPGRIAPMRLISAAARTDPRLQGASYLYTVAAESGAVPGMRLLASLPSGPAAEGSVVPERAIVWWQDRAWAYQRVAEGRFTRIQIPTDLPASAAAGGISGYIVRDLPKSAALIVRGAQLLLSEEFRAQIQVGEDQE